jgi:hypothetical protein
MQNKMYEQLLFFLFIFKLSPKDLEQKDFLENKILLYTVQKKYSLLLINFIKYFYPNANNKTEFINNYCNKIKENENKPILFYYLSFVLHKSEIIIDVKDDFISYLKDLFLKNYLIQNNNSKILSISSLLLLSGYYMINQKEDSDKIKEFKKILNNYNVENKIIYHLLDIINIILKGSIEINVIIYNNSKELKTKKLIMI